MAKPFPLQTVHELMGERLEDATQLLARLIASEQEAKNKLDMLLTYRDEYAMRFSDAAKSGLRQSEWQNYQEFLSRLDEAIDSQRKVVAQQVLNTQSGQNNWQQHKKKLTAFDTLSERHFANENAREAKLDQKNQDEFSARAKNLYQE